SQYWSYGGEVVEMRGARCDPRAKPHGKPPPGAQCWRRKQTIPKSANITPTCGMRGPRWRKDVSPSTFLTRRSRRNRWANLATGSMGQFSDLNFGTTTLPTI